MSSVHSYLSSRGFLRRFSRGFIQRRICRLFRNTQDAEFSPHHTYKIVLFFKITEIFINCQKLFLIVFYIFVEDKLIPALVCTDVTVRCDADIIPGAPYVSVLDMVAPTMSVDNAMVSESVIFGSENSAVVDVDITVISNHSWV